MFFVVVLAEAFESYRSFGAGDYSRLEEQCSKSSVAMRKDFEVIEHMEREERSLCVVASREAGSYRGSESVAMANRTEEAVEEAVATWLMVRKVLVSSSTEVREFRPPISFLILRSALRARGISVVLLS